MKNMHLHAQVCGVDDSVGMGVTESEWKKMTDDEQNNLIREYLSSVVDVWTEAREEE